MVGMADVWASRNDRKQLETARQMASEINDPYQRFAALREIAVEMAKVGASGEVRKQFEAALRTADTIADSGQRSDALSEIAVDMAKAGYLRIARNTALSIRVSRESGSGGKIAETLAEIGLVDAERESGDH